MSRSIYDRHNIVVAKLQDWIEYSFYCFVGICLCQQKSRMCKSVHDVVVNFYTVLFGSIERGFLNTDFS